MEFSKLEKQTYFSLRTLRKNGVAVDTPVWFARVDEQYVVFSAKQAGKVKRIRNNTQVEIAPCTVNGTVTGQWLAASAQLVDETTVIEKTYHALKKKYGWQMHMLNLMSWLSGKIKHRQVIAINRA